MAASIYVRGILIRRYNESVLFFKRVMFQPDDLDYDESKKGTYYWKKIHTIDYEANCNLSALFAFSIIKRVLDCMFERYHDGLTEVAHHIKCKIFVS